MNTLAMSWGQLAYEHHRSAGTPLLFLHGTGCDAADWEQTLAALPEDTHWLAADFRGHGRSAVPTEPFVLGDLADDVLCLVASCGLASVCLVGHSLGGMVAMAAAGRSPHVCRLVLLEGWTRLAVMPRAFDDRRFYGALPPAAVARIRAKHDATRARFALALWDHFWASVERFDARDYLARASIPIVEVYGARGRYPDAERNLDVPARPNIRWVWIESAGHYLPHECPQEVAGICRLT